MLAIVELVKDELMECLQRLCAIVNADDELDMYLVVDRCDKLTFEALDASPSVDVVWISDETSPDSNRELFECVVPLWFGILNVRKPIDAEFLFTKIFGDSDRDKYDIVVTNESDFPSSVREYLTNYHVYGWCFSYADLRYLKGLKSCV